MKTTSTFNFLALMVALFTAQTINAQTNLALNKTATASSLEGNGYAASYAFDGNQGTRFSSGFTDNEWISVDLGASHRISSVVLTWERAYGTDFNILFSNNGTYTDLNIDSIQVRNNSLSGNSTAGTNTITAKAGTIARYVRMQGIHRATQYGYSLWEFQVMGNTAVASALPVTLINLSAAKQNNNVFIQWTTVIEMNNDGFSIERSEDGAHFNAIGWVKGQNKGSVTSNYSYTDNQPASGRNYYRIRQVDVDGRSTYTTVISVNNNNNSSAAGVKAYPVPVKDHLIIEYKGTANEKITVSIFNAAGQAVYNNSVNIATGEQTMVINRTTGMTAGTYFLAIISNGNKTYTQQLFLQ